MITDNNQDLRNIESLQIKLASTEEMLVWQMLRKALLREVKNVSYSRFFLMITHFGGINFPLYATKLENIL